MRIRTPQPAFRLSPRWLVAVAALGLAAGCAHAPPRLGASEQVRTGAGLFLLELEPEDAAGAALVREALLAAGPRLARWGELSEPVTVKVLPDHQALERAVGREGYDWLRAWARREVVFVQSPSSWFPGGGATLPQVSELLLHELTHCVMYQAAATEDAWQRKGIPVWFREGMASVTADQGYRRGSLIALSRMLASGGPDPLHAPNSLLREQSDLVYTAAHHAFGFLVRRYGDRSVKAILAAMRSGQRFDQAFESAVGLPVDAFEREFRGYVLMQGWRSRMRR